MAKNKKLAFALVYLGQNRINGRTPGDMKKAFRKYLLKSHPDKNKNAVYDHKVRQFYEVYEKYAAKVPKKMARGLFAVHWIRDAIGSTEFKAIELNPSTLDLTGLSFISDTLKGGKRHAYSKCDMHVNFLMSGFDMRKYKPPHNRSIKKEFENWLHSKSTKKPVAKTRMLAIEYRKSVSKTAPKRATHGNTVKARWFAINKKSPCRRKNLIRNPETLRCRGMKACGSGKARSAISGRCKKVTACGKNSIRNHISMRCNVIRPPVKARRVVKTTRRTPPKSAVERCKRRKRAELLELWKHKKYPANAKHKLMNKDNLCNILEGEFA